MWPNYITASTAMNLFNISGTIFAELLRVSSYINDRRPKKANFRDASKGKMRWQTLKKRLLHLNNTDFDWIGPEVGKN